MIEKACEPRGGGYGFADPSPRALARPAPPRGACFGAWPNATRCYPQVLDLRGKPGLTTPAVRSKPRPDKPEAMRPEPQRSVPSTRVFHTEKSGLRRTMSARKPGSSLPTSERPSERAWFQEVALTS